jgi:CheY-like chemotaxis protein
MDTAGEARSVRVLLVDDEALLRRALARIREHAGNEVVTAGGGREAIAHLESSVFDVIVSDIRMPGMDGLVT